MAIKTLAKVVAERDTYAVAARTEQRAIRGDRDAGHGHILLRKESVRALVLAEVPHAHVPRAITAHQFALVRVNDHIVDGAAMHVVALHGAGLAVPDLDRAVLGSGGDPLALDLEGHARHVGGVALERERRRRVGRADVVELDVRVAGCRDEALVGRDAEAVDLGLRVLDRARADAREGLPEADGVVVTGCGSKWSADCLGRPADQQRACARGDLAGEGKTHRCRE